jgi:hypothetical protein
MSAPYQPPLDQLLALGRPEVGNRHPWPDYLAMGFTGEHVPELIRMATDAELAAGDEDAAPTYAGIHAWRTLGQLRAEAAIDPLLGLLDPDDDWMMDELPMVLGMIGPAAFEPLRSALTRGSREPDPWAAGAAANGLVDLATAFPEMRDAVVAALTRQLSWWARNDPNLNTMLIADLATLGAVEAAPVMEEAFAAGAVDMDFTDDWEDVQVRLGLLPERITPRPAYVPPAWLSSAPFLRVLAAKPAAAAKRRKKAGKAARQRKGKRR